MMTKCIIKWTMLLTMAALLTVMLCGCAKQDAAEQTQTPDPSMEKYKIGSHVFFGMYRQDAEREEPTPIEWIVIDQDGTDVLLLSRYVLDTAVFNEELQDVTWETCTLRPWLNTVFFETAFGEDERQYIVPRTVLAQDTRNQLTDAVFLLSSKEADGYLMYAYARPKCAATPYVAAQRIAMSMTQTVDDLPTCSWWFRDTVTKTPDPETTYYAALITNTFGSRGSDCWSRVDSRMGIRPAVWISMH